MATVVVAPVRHGRLRARTLSLKVSNSFLLLLPTELFITILETVIRQCKPRDLAIVSSAFCRAVNAILYRTVVLNSPETLRLFYRTTQSKHPTFFADHVKRIVVTDQSITSRSHPHLDRAISICSGVRSMVVPSYDWPKNPLFDDSAHEHGLIALTFKSHDGMNVPNTRGMNRSTMTFSNIAYLRFCEPGDLWCSPISLLGRFGSLPHLSHLQLARRANANQANDEIFMKGISQLLILRPNLKMLVVSIFPGAFSTSEDDAHIESSEIWCRMSELCRTDHRLILLHGHYGEWKRGWEDFKAIRGGWHPPDFWTQADSQFEHASNR
ncbi:hypothetical protein H0H92_008642 [Tricholoma furcatifolium]|nr:hypothetical protein H0H92_008642 [Tricholoma furcatifolium]